MEEDIFRLWNLGKRMDWDDFTTRFLATKKKIWGSGSFLTRVMPDVNAAVEFHALKQKMSYNGQRGHVRGVHVDEDGSNFRYLVQVEDAEMIRARPSNLQAITQDGGAIASFANLLAHAMELLAPLGADQKLEKQGPLEAMTSEELLHAACFFASHIAALACAETAITEGCCDFHACSSAGVFS